jgi:hypothetical protein
MRAADRVFAGQQISLAAEYDFAIASVKFSMSESASVHE